MNTEYKLKKITPDILKYTDELKKNKIPDILAQLYALRNIKDFNDINLFQKLEPFKNMKGIFEACELLYQSIINKERICVVADYDADGATACAVAVRGLAMFGANIDFVVPNRFIHGYGLKPSVVDEAITKKNPHLIVTVDNGMASHEGIDYAHSKGIKVLVTDHHLPGNSLPKADAIVNPNQPNCQFKSKCIAGCGVIFYVICALRQYMINKEIYSLENAPKVFSLLDYVAIGTIADVVFLDKNNKILVKLGLELIHSGKTKPGILSLINISKSQYHTLTSIDIGFKIGPRLNAAGRLEDMSIGINCLLTNSIERAEQLAIQLNEMNLNRKKIENEMKESVSASGYVGDTSFGKVAYDPSFHEGVIGIVASRIKEQFYRPTIVFADSHHPDHIKGSGRSIPEIHLRDALDYVFKKDPSIIVNFGGHSMAAGITIFKNRLSDFSQLFDEAVLFYSNQKELINKKEIDLNLPQKYLTVDTAELITNEIWGQGFPPPLFLGNFNIIEQKILKDAHLKLKLEKNGEIYDAIWFSHADIIECENIDIIYTLGINDFRNERNIQLLIENIFKTT